MQDEKHKNPDKWLYREEEVSQVQMIPSIPFQIYFNIPVVKLACGDLFCALLTAEG